MKNCATCGRNLDGRWERLTPGICRTLVQFWTKVVEKKVNQVHLQRDLELDKNAYNNFQKLRYFGLVAKVKDMSGYWLITRRGAQFVHGKTRVNKQVRIFDNHIVERSLGTTSILEVMACQTYWPLAEWFIPVDHVEQQHLF